jgi:ferrochelatase
MDRHAVLLINLGTPDSPSVGNVRKYLFQFLNDPRVIDIPWLLRKILVNLIIVPFRAPKSAAIYKKLWTKNGSPLLIHGLEVQKKLAESLPQNHKVFLAMRYGNPSVDSVMKEISAWQPNRITVLPMFPQYASSSSGSAMEAFFRAVSSWWVIPEIKMISQFFYHPGYINAFVERGRQYPLSDFDHFLFSYHGLPVRQVDKVYPNDLCKDHNCESSLDEENLYCYKAACYETTRRIAAGLGIPEKKYTVAFQSRLDKNWLKPFSDEIVESMPSRGIKKLLVFSPAFVADCLETTIEIGEEYEHLFKKAGGEKLQLVESLNSHPLWIETIRDLVINGPGNPPV